jgi:hypothetical protein
MAFIAAAVVGGVGAIAGGLMGADAARDSAETQLQASREATALQREIYNQNRADTQQWRDAGGRALTQMEDPSFNKSFSMADFQADPGYAFRLQEGQKALERSAAARGGLMSGGTMKALTGYGQGMASQEYQSAYNRFTGEQDRRFNRLSTLAGFGQNAVSQTGQAGQNFAQQAGQNIMAGGAAQAGGQMGAANAIAGGIGGAANNWMQYQMMNRAFPVKKPGEG